MDKPIDPRVRLKGRLLQYGLIAILVVGAISYLALRDDRTSVRLSRDRLTVETVREAPFQDYIAFIGSVEPIQTVYLDATEGGRVEEIFIREGTAVEQDDPIIRLSNDTLHLQIANYETEVARATNDLRTMRLTLENQQFSNQSSLIEYEFEITKLERDLANNEQLYTSGGITRETLQTTRDSLAKQRKQRELLARKSITDTSSFATRIAGASEMVESMQKNLAVSRSRLEKLIVRAPMNGELASLNSELGEVVAVGTRIGTINVLESYKIRAEVDEHYIARVSARLSASCEFTEREYAATITKVYPEVNRGKFGVDLVFAGNVPPEIRIGQTTRVRLELGESQRAVLLPRGSFYQSTGGKWVFVLDPETKTARKRPIELGRQNPAYYEVLHGLSVGEQVITSGYEAFAATDQIILP